MTQKLLFILLLSCFTTLSVAQVANPPNDLNGCENNTDGFYNFDLTQVESDVLQGQTASNFSISYHLTQVAADTAVPQIGNPNNFTNSTNPQTIFVRLEEISSGNFDTTSFDIEVNDDAVAYPFSGPFELCDDNIEFDGNTTNDSVTFDLSSQDTEVLGNDPGNPQPAAGFTVSYYATLSDANTNINPLPSLYTNITNPQVIYARVDNNNGFCYDVTPLTLQVNEIPSPNSPTVLNACDDLDANYYEDNDGFTTFDLTVKDGEITNNNASLVVTYHTTQASAQSGTVTIPNPTMFTNTVNSVQTLYVRVVDANTSCFSTTTLTVRVRPNPSPTQNPMDLELCDDTSIPGNIEMFDLTVNEIDILNGEPGIISYYTSLNDALAGVNPIVNPTMHANEDPSNPGTGVSPQTIYVRVTTSAGCFTIVNFDVIVNTCTNGVINVEVYNDINNSNTFDSGETNYSLGNFTYEKNNDGVINEIFTSNGQFQLYPDNASDFYEIKYFVDNTSCLTVPTDVYPNVTTSSGVTSNVFFAVQETNSNCSSDIGVTLFGNTPPRPGQVQLVGLQVKNYNGTPASGSVEFVIDNQVSLNNVITTGVVTNTATGFTLDFSNIAQGESLLSYVYIDIPTTMTIGDVVTHHVNNNAADLNLDNNAFTLSSNVVNSYDPNDITEAHGNKIVFNDFTQTDEYLYYTIRFQNLGTAEAIDISVENTLSNLLDVSTFKMISSSHNYVVNRVGNQLTYTMNGINLPSQTQNNLESNGFLVYRIKPMAGYGVGTIIPNTAEIYFDFNPAVITNTYQTEFVQNGLSVSDFKISQFKIYPNPTRNNLFIKTAFKTNASLNIFNVLGKTVLTQENLDFSLVPEINLSKLNSGIYFINISNKNSNFIKKIVVE
jgi:hypothetical protein